MISIERYIKIEKDSDTPVYLQIADSMANLIKEGILPAGVRIIPTRDLAQRLQVHRKTIVKALDELLAQGLVQSRPRQGIFVATQFLTMDHSVPKMKAFPDRVNFVVPYQLEDSLVRKTGIRPYDMAFNDGFPDVRLAPFDSLMREYNSLGRRKLSRKLLSYSAKEGSLSLREALANNLRQTRGMPVTADNILITKGAQLAIYLVSSLLVKPGDNVIVAGPNYFLVNHMFRRLRAKVHFVPTDADGMQVAEAEKLCKKLRVRMIYVIPHHHHPTTVTLSSERRLKLLALADRYRIAVIEDDYDFDVYYDKEPVLPLSSIDRNGNVIYVGTLSKVVAPSIRVGYLVAPRELIALLAQHRFVIDMQGDNILEEALASLFNNGIIDRHLKKIRKVYRERRDFICDFLTQELPDNITFTRPVGGMSVWARYNGVQSSDVSRYAAQKKLFVCDGTKHDYNDQQMNAVSLGFASMNTAEVVRALEVFKGAVRQSLRKK